jgi:uncharacterized protein (DUF952 family)
MSTTRPEAGSRGPYTLHMLPAVRWSAWRDGPPGASYEPEGFAADGFVHCTDGEEEMVATANRHYRADPRVFVVLELDLAAVGAPWRYDDPGRRYPHIYGPLARAGVRSAAAFLRAPDGTFTAFCDRRQT